MNDLRPRLLGGLFVAGALAFGVYVLGGLAYVAFAPAAPGPGDPAPEFTAPTLDGRTSGLDRYAGRVVLLDFWTTTCVGCIGSTPRLNRMHEEYGPRGFAVVSLNQEPDALDRVRRVVRERNIRYPVLIDEGDIASAYGVAAFPTVVLLGPDGVIRAVHVGAVAESRLRAEIEALLEVSAPSARLAPFVPNR